jgi:integrase
MASIQKDPRSPYWQVFYTRADGKRIHRSTRQTDRRKALEVCRAVERANEKARAGELTEAVVRKLLNEVMDGVGEDPVRSVSVRTFAQTWLGYKQPAVRPGVLRLYRRALERFCDCLGAKADKPLAAIVPGDIAAFQAARTSEVSAGTALLDLKAVRSLLDNARRQGLIPSNPAEAIDLPANRPNTREVFELDELRSLLRAASTEWQTLILLGYYLGARLSDAKAMRWSAVDLASGQLRYTQSKTAEEVVVPIHADLLAHLLALPASDAPDAFLCPVLAKKRNDGRLGLSTEFLRLMRVAGIDSLSVQSQKRSVSRKSYHALRHSFASALANAGVSQELRMALTGHLSASAHKRYTHLQMAPLTQAISLLPSVRTDAAS